MNRKPIPRGRHAFAESQRILELLRTAGPAGVSRATLIFEHHYTQCGTRVFDLEQMGWVIRHETLPEQQYVTYFLVSEPTQPKPLPTFAEPTRQLEATTMPLFVGVESRR